MKQIVSIVMYHYVRELKNSRYPEIKGLDVNLFKEQIGYIKKHYTVISAFDVMDAVEGKNELPPNALLLTFDDAYIDHFTQVFPILDKEKISGCFFPPAKCILEKKVLVVNKIHFILASVENKRTLIDSIYKLLDENRSFYKLESNEFYWQKYGHASRFDTAEVMFIKFMLQRELPEELRNLITDDLFRKFVTGDEKAFSSELYMSTDQISCLQRNNMYIGSHGFDHYWLSSLSEKDQEREIELSLQFLKSINGDIERWIMCYPYGAFNDSLLHVLKKYNCIVGLTTRVALANLKEDNPLTLPRLDTNDLPKNANEKMCDWTKKAIY